MNTIVEKLTARALDEAAFHFAPQVLLFTALKLGVFSAVAEGEKSVQHIGAATGCSLRGMRMMLDCLTAMGLLKKKGGTYDLNSLSRRFFLPSSEDYVGELFRRLDLFLNLWLTLPEAVKTGRPTISCLQEEERARLNLSIVDALFQCHKGYAWKLSERLEESDFFPTGAYGGMKILDIGAGSAVWSIPFTLKYKDVEVTAVDFDAVLDVAKRYTRRFGVERCYRFIGANIREIEFGSDQFDLVLLGHVCHSEGEQWTRKLLFKCFRALRKGGRLLIMDYISDEKRKSAFLPLLLALNALLGTEEGDTFTFSQYEHWLLDVGFRDVRTMEIRGHSPVVAGRKS